MSERETIYEDPYWEAVEFEDGELSTTEAIVARGQFWISYNLGKIRPINDLPPGVDTMVMIKSCPRIEHAICYKGLQAEMNILHNLSHFNVVKLVGYCFGNPLVSQLQLVFEYCANGNLRKVLQKGRPYFDRGTYCPRKIITLEVISSGVYLNFCGWHLLKWTAEIARGMEYLAFKGVIHSDLAARNILLSGDWTAKIGNFGISQRHKVQDFSNVCQLAKEVLPLAWMAPESIKNLTFSERSDVWSYSIWLGVTDKAAKNKLICKMALWEIYTLGEVPFRDDNDENDIHFVEKLAQGIRPARAEHANEHIWNLITSCWEFDPEKRPTFSKIKTFLERTVFLTKPDWDAKMSLSGRGSFDSGTSGSSTLKKTKNGTAKKKVVFLPPVATGSLLKKCVCSVDDALVRNGLKIN